MLDRYELPRLNAALAHEMGHLRRHDNEWRIASRIAAIVGWLQPLNRLATKRLDESAELCLRCLGGNRDWIAPRAGLQPRGLRHPSRVVTTGSGAHHRHGGELVSRCSSESRNYWRTLKWKHDDLKRAAWWSSAALIGIAVAGSFIVVSTLDDDVPPRWLATNGLYQSLRNSDQNVHTSRSVIIKSPEQVRLHSRHGETFRLPTSSPRRARGERRSFQRRAAA